jgi:ArsR family transcriptional regulator, arsenate/arsenite/antimonite-responsive transcriptional repressor
MTRTNSVSFAKALADETRQQIMRLCCCRELSVNEIAEQTGVSQPTVSHHLAILRDADLVSLRSAGRQTYYTLNQERIAVCCGQLLQVFAPESEVTEVVKTVCEC